jgi:LysM repeat protein
MIYRRGFKIFGLLAVLIGLFVHDVSAQSTVHVVVKGDTLYSISHLYRVSQEEIMRRNGITDASRIQIGMRLTIPSGQAFPPSAVPPAAASPTAVSPAAASPPTVPSTPVQTYTEYTVSRNDTLYSIARNRGVTLQALRDINGFSKDYVIKAGEKIKIPGSASPLAVATPRPNTAPTPAATPPATARTPAAGKEPAQAGQRRASLSLRWPVTAREVLYMNGKLPGVLVTGVKSESIKSLTRGTVIAAGPYRGYGNVAIIESEGGYLYLYGSCEALSVKQGDRVGAGTELGKLGIYPASGKPDLVFLVYRNDSPIDPARAPRAL